MRKPKRKKKKLEKASKLKAERTLTRESKKDNKRVIQE